MYLTTKETRDREKAAKNSGLVYRVERRSSIRLSIGNKETKREVCANRKGGEERKKEKSMGTFWQAGLFKSITMLTVGLLCPRLSNR